MKVITLWQPWASKAYGTMIFSNPRTPMNKRINHGRDRRAFYQDVGFDSDDNPIYIDENNQRQPCKRADIVRRSPMERRELWSRRSHQTGLINHRHRRLLGNGTAYFIQNERTDHRRIPQDRRQPNE